MKWIVAACASLALAACVQDGGTTPEPGKTEGFEVTGDPEVSAVPLTPHYYNFDLNRPAPDDPSLILH